MSKKKDIVSQRDIEVAKEKTKKGLKSALAIGCYNSETDNEIGRSKEHAKHMRRTRRQNFARKMNLIDPHYGKKAAGVLAAGTALGLAATTIPGVGAVAGPAVGGGVIAGGLAFLETDAHRAVGDHAILDSLLDDRDDNWRTNTTLSGYDGHGDNISDFDRQQMLTWSDSDEDDGLDELLPEGMSERRKSAAPASVASNSNPLFDAVDDSNSQKYPSMDSLGLFDSNDSQNQKTNSSSVPRPPSPQLGAGERTTNPHSSNTVQSMGNSFSTLNLFDQPTEPAEDDFFASLTSTPPLQPTTQKSSSFSSDIPPQIGAKLNQGTQGNTSGSNDFDFFADFSGSASTNTPTTNANKQSNGGSFFADVASHIPSNKPQNSQANSDPFADLYARPSNNAPNYTALQGMRKF